MNLINMSTFLSHWSISMPTAVKPSRIRKNIIKVLLLLKMNFWAGDKQTDDSSEFKEPLL